MGRIKNILKKSSETKRENAGERTDYVLCPSIMNDGGLGLFRRGFVAHPSEEYTILLHARKRLSADRCEY